MLIDLWLTSIFEEKVTFVIERKNLKKLKCSFRVKWIKKNKKGEKNKAQKKPSQKNK